LDTTSFVLRFALFRVDGTHLKYLIMLFMCFNEENEHTKMKKES